MKNKFSKKSTESLFLAVYEMTAWYTEGDQDKTQHIQLVAENKYDAWDQAVFYFAVDGIPYDCITTQELYPLFYARY